MQDQNQQNKLNIELSEDMAQGIYSNLAVITHSGTEFVLDFISMMPGVPKAHVKSRIVVAPENAKRLLMALQDNVAKYEAQHGPIRQNDNGNAPMNFGVPTAKA